jgi:phosphonate C-P lyase system protein PhnG
VEYLRGLLLKMAPAELQALANTLPLEEVEVTATPQTGLIMGMAQDCFETDFYLGEILVTRTEVAYQGQRAQVTLIGDCPQAAILAAALEILAQAQREDSLSAALKAAEPAARRIADDQAREDTLVAATRVNFQTMAEEESLG